MQLTTLAVRRPITTLMACLIVVLLGWESLRRLSVDLMPDVTYPTISVTTIYPGAGPEEIETLITRPLEQQFSSLQGVDSMVSTSMEGSSTIRVRFRWETNVDSAISDARAKIERIRYLLPENIEPPYIRRFDVADSPILYIGLSSELPAVELTQLAEQTIVPQLERVDGVASVRLRGGVRREIQVNVHRRKLEALNMGVNDVVEALRRDNVNQPAGDVVRGNLKQLIRSRGEFVSLQQIADTVVRENTGAIVRVSDLADVIDGEEERTELARVNGTPGVFVYIYKQAGANTVDVSDNVRRAIAEINASLVDSHLTIRIDKSRFIREAISNVRESAVYGMALSVLVLVLFLRNFRSTLVIAISMPLSVLATFTLIYFKGFTLNMVSFGGLALGIGLLVDNSIVVLESIFRKFDEGLDPQRAAIEGTHEVGAAIIASTLTTLIVFVPLMFVSGMTGILLQQLAWVVSFSLICSLLASLTLTPVLAAYWIGSRRGADAKGLTARLVSAFHGMNLAIFSAVEVVYQRVLQFCLRFAGATSFVFFAAFCCSLGLFPLIGTEYFPKADEGNLRVNTKMAPGIRLERLDEQARLVERVILENVSESASTAAFIGGQKDDANEWNEARFFVNLVPRDERERGIEEVRKDLASRIEPVPGMEIRVQASTEMMLLRMLSRNNSSGDVQVEVRGHDLLTAERVADQVVEIMQGIPGLVNVEAAKEDRRPELATLVDRTKAGLLGVSVQDITSALETTIRGTNTTVFREKGDEFNVVVRLQEQDRSAMGDVEQVGISTPSGKIVPLKNLVDFNPGESPVAITRVDQQRTLTVTGDLEDSDLGSVVQLLQQELRGVQVPEGFTVSVSGDWEDQQESFTALRMGFLLAVLMMYMVMASQFESLWDPLLILVSVPLGLIGVILVLVATETTLNVQSFIGLVMLAGIVVNNAIVLVDYLNLLRRTEPHLAPAELVTRACLRRFRPILMTTLTTVLAMLPISFGWGDGGELQAPMARVVIGGLTSGTLITLLILPIIYQTILRQRRRPASAAAAEAVSGPQAAEARQPAVR